MDERRAPPFHIGDRWIGPGHPVYVVAELSGNHNGEFDRAVALLEAAHAAGADAFKLQTYTADTITFDGKAPCFRINGGPWDGRMLHELYREAATPWDWQPRLKRRGDEMGIEVFSTPFDATAVDFLEREVGVAAYKIASFEVVDIPLLKQVARTGKPVIVSTGMASRDEIDLAVRTLREGGASEVALLHCVSAYPSDPAQMNLAKIPALARDFGVVAGLSDHSLSPAVPVVAVALGASIIEKHLTLSRADGGPDAAFSLEPAELAELVTMVRQAAAAVGSADAPLSDVELENTRFRKSIFVVENIAAGEPFTRRNTRVIRPGQGLPPALFEEILGRRAAQDIDRGTPVGWELVGDGDD